MTIILKCNCVHEFQDKTYGTQKRVHNISGDSKKAFCTVCCPSNRRNNTVNRPARTGKSI